MGKKDVTGRMFFSDRERFAELLNLHFYHGEQVLLPENLIQRKGEYPSLADVYGQKNRDILMEDTKRKIYYGVELETETDYSMPERVMVYDACEYEQQIRKICRKHREKEEFKNYREMKSRIKRGDFLVPTVTVVLYLGEGHWEGRRRLVELFEPPAYEKNRCVSARDIHFAAENLQSCGICDYEFSLLEADYIKAEDYKTDLKEFFLAMQCRQDRGKLKRLLQSEGFQNLTPETELAIAAHLNVKRLVRRIEKEGVSMCKAFEELMQEERKNGKKEGIEKGLEKGIRKGERKGKREERIDIIGRMKKEGMDKAQIIRLTKCTKEEYAAAPGI